MMHIWQMRWRWLQILGLICLVVAFNPLTLFPWIHALDLMIFHPETYYYSLWDAAVIVSDAWAMLTIILLLRKKTGLVQLFRANAGYVGATCLCGLLYMLAVNPIFAGYFQWLRVLLPIGNLWLLAKAFHLGFVKAEAKWLLRLRPVATAAFSILAICLVLEGVFMFVAKSQTNDNALASKVWFARYWEGNVYGFRERKDRPIRALVGDSFVAGHGIRDPRNRFGDLINQAQPKAIPYYNMGVNGASTEDELKMLQEGWQLEEVVLVWYVNDIQEIARESGLRTGNEILRRPWPISLIHGSYLINYLVGLFPNETVGQNYLDFLHCAYTDTGVLRRYFKVCRDLHAYCMERKWKLTVVLFPMMNLVDGSAFAIDPVRQFWAEQQVPCLDLTPVYRGHAAQELVVNSSDAHPNEFANKLAADAILTFLNTPQSLGN